MEQASSTDTGRAALYVNWLGYPDYDEPVKAEVENELRKSGFSTLLLFGLHVHGDGRIFFDDNEIIDSEGTYQGVPGWGAWLRKLRSDSAIDRIEVTVGSAGAADWQNIKKLIGDKDKVLSRNFATLQREIQVDALNNDDESCYDVDSTVKFADMLREGGIFANFTLAPYDVRKIEYWKAVRNTLDGYVDRVYLQCYDGGKDNKPEKWNDAMGMAVDPGLWCKHDRASGCTKGDSPATVEDRMRGWRKDAGIPGGFMWCYPDMRTCSEKGAVADYATAITRAFTNR